MLNIDTIVTDMDDTLLNENGSFSEYTLSVLRRCMDRGIRVICASGRTHASLSPLMKILNTGLPYIGGNGSELIGADHQVMDVLTLDLDLTKEIIRRFLKEDFHVQVYRGEHFYYGKECEASRYYQAASGLKGVEVGDLCAFLDFVTPKILAVSTPERVAELFPVITKEYSDRVFVTVSKPFFIEIESLDACKGNALKRLAKYVKGIDPEKTVAFGDSLNDLTLLQFTPNSVAVGNARDELKRQAAYVCGKNTEDGPAHFLEEMVLG